uniref:Uncharacterized protein n=1 Tax=Cyanistes caeruleus TaxID=156563 RepID=A0A8C0US72_CYACU
MQWWPGEGMRERNTLKPFLLVLLLAFGTSSGIRVTHSQGSYLQPTQSASLCTNTLNIGCLLDTNLTFPLHLKNTKRLSWKNYGNKLGREARYFSKGFSRQVSICKSHSHHGRLCTDTI